MSKERFLFTSESVTEGHPDKLADQISDAILDSILEKDPMGRVAAETLVTTGLITIAGEITTSCYVDIPKIARQTAKEVGYTRAKYGFDASTCSVLTSIDEQSPDISQGVTTAIEARNLSSDEIDKIGAGDQGMMFGFATNETEELMPLPITLAHKLTRQLAKVRKENILPYLRPDGKSQVTVEYVEGNPVRLDTIVLSTQHHPAVAIEQIEKDLKEFVIAPIIPENFKGDKIKILVNPTGRFVLGGPAADCGLTGRKIIVDTYGGSVPHGGGAFSGKDPTKVDRSAAYMARYAAKNLVAAGLADSCTLQVSYAIGVARPVSLMIDTKGTGKISDEKLTSLVQQVFDFRPAAIINNLDLRKPQYKRLAAYGHFGRTDLSPLPAWEKTDKVKELLDLL